MSLKKVSRHFPLCSSHHEKKNDKVIVGRVHRFRASTTVSWAFSQTRAADLRLPLCVTCLIYPSLSVSLSLNIFSPMEWNLNLHPLTSSGLGEAPRLKSRTATVMCVSTVRKLSEQNSQYSWGCGQEFNTSAHLDTGMLRSQPEEVQSFLCLHHV